MFRKLLGSIFGSPSKPAVLPVPRAEWVGFDSPSAALLALENAYRERDIEAAVLAKNFQFEGEAMIRKLGDISDPDLFRQAAEVLELSYRKHAREGGLPDLTGMITSVTSETAVTPDLVQIVERIEHPDGQTTEESVFAARTDGRWGIVTISA